MSAISLICPAAPAPTPAIIRLDGIDQSSGIHYLRLYLDGTLLTPTGPQAAAVAPPPSSPPALIAQCTSSASGKLAFELLANFGGITDTTYYPPWRPSKDDLYPPRLKKPNMTMEFLGYTHVKPVKRQWEALSFRQGQYRYNTPSGTSNNMEDITYYLRYLLALPPFISPSTTRPPSSRLPLSSTRYAKSPSVTRLISTHRS